MLANSTGGHPIGMRDVRDGLTSTAAFSESTSGNGLAGLSSRPLAGLDPMLVAIDINGSTMDPVTCAGTTTYTGQRGDRWINGGYLSTAYNHYLLPNSISFDCLNSANNYRLKGGRSWHPAGINTRPADTWRPGVNTGSAPSPSSPHRASARSPSRGTGSGSTGTAAPGRCSSPPATGQALPPAASAAVPRPQAATRPSALRTLNVDTPSPAARACSATIRAARIRARK